MTWYSSLGSRHRAERCYTLHHSASDDPLDNGVLLDTVPSIATTGALHLVESTHQNILGAIASRSSTVVSSIRALAPFAYDARMRSLAVSPSSPSGERNEQR